MRGPQKHNHRFRGHIANYFRISFNYIAKCHPQYHIVVEIISSNTYTSHDNRSSHKPPQEEAEERDRQL